MSYNNSKVLQTKYKGYWFRSRTEARWAVFLDSLGVKWEYEIEAFRLSSKNYWPDFWLPEWKCWLEIKGIEPTILELKVCEELHEATERPVVIAWGLPSITSGYMKVYCEVKKHILCNNKIVKILRGKMWRNDGRFAYDKTGRVCINSCIIQTNPKFITQRYLNENSKELFYAMKMKPDCGKSLEIEHINNAKSARFEECTTKS